MAKGFWTTDDVSWRHALLVFVVAMLLRAWSFTNPIVDVDEPQFAGFAHALLDGGIPYLASVDTKPLGVYWFFAAIFALFGRTNMIAVHAATALVVVATAFFCYRMGRRLASNSAGFWAALFYVVFTTTFIPKFVGTSITILMMFPLAMSADVLLAWEERGGRWRLFVSGLLWGVACLFKYQAGINLVVAGGYLLVVRPLFFRSFREIRVLEFLLFLVGGMAVGGLFALYLHVAGAWEAFAFWSLEGSAAYVEKAAGHTSLLAALPVRGGSLVASTFLIWYFGFRRAGRAVRLAFAQASERRPRPGELFVVLWLLLSVIPTLTGGKLYGHYFYQMFPQLCVLAGIWTIGFFAWAGEGRRRFAVILFAVAITLPAAGFTAARLAADRIYAAIGEENPKDYIRVGEYLRGHTAPGEPIFVWGFGTTIYFYAERPAVSRFLWCDWLTGRISGTPSAKDPVFDTTAFITPGSWAMLFADLERTPPAYIVDTSPGNYHDYGKYPIAKYPELAAYLKAHYRLETTIDKIDIYRRVVP